MDIRPARKLTSALLPLISLGLIVTSFVMDDWYTVDHLDGEKSEGTIWSEYEIEYGLLGFSYLEVWSGILGDNYHQESKGYNEEFENFADYNLTSIIILFSLHLILLLIGFVSALRGGHSVIPIIIAIIILAGSVLVIYNIHTEMEGLVHDHIDDDLPPSDIRLSDEIKEGLKGSGNFGMSFFLLIPVPVIMMLSIFLSIDIGKDREPTKRNVENGFFRN